MTAFSFQLYSAREFPPLDALMKMLAEAGYAQVEGYGGVYEDLAATKAAMEATGLTMPSGHFSMDMLENDQAKVLEIANTLGVKHIYCPYLAEELRPTTSAEWAAFAKRLEALHAIYAPKGFTFGWHNHDFEFVALPDGGIPMDVILENAPSITWEADIAWVVRGGADPFAWIKKYSSRISSVHVKDIAPQGECADEDGWADVGHGTIDWPALMSALKSTNVELYVMEHDKPNDATRFAQRSIAAANTF
ncbi:MAG: sugar phosphate isomerase/epimerase [Rhodobacteraceae bacterium]|nr:sugar phosphate isomerase/epimerase [Paracoccaceae bacterium]